MPKRERTEDDAMGFGTIEALLDSLVPPDDVEVEDVDGHKYRLRGRASASAQIVLFREVQALVDSGGISGGVEKVRSGDVAAIADLLLRSASDEESVARVALIFEAAHPKAVREALARAKERDQDAGSVRIQDLFGIEELVAGLAPLFVRLAARLFRMVVEAKNSKRSR
jgi:hypothetical protein